MLQIAIIDDENAICSYLEKQSLLLAEKYGVTVDIEVYYSGEEVLWHLKKDHYYDLIFLDIELHELSGFDISKVLREEMKNGSTQIVYISGTSEYALQTFDYDPLYFLPKPLKNDDIEKVFCKFMQRMHIKAEAFAYKVGHESFKIPIKEIAYFQSDDRKITVYYYKKNHIATDTFYSTLENVQKQLDTTDFLRIHKSYLINPAYVSRYAYEEVNMANGTILPIAQSKRKEIRSAQMKFMREEF